MPQHQTLSVHNWLHETIAKYCSHEYLCTKALFVPQRCSFLLQRVLLVLLLGFETRIDLKKEIENMKENLDISHHHKKIEIID